MDLSTRPIGPSRLPAGMIRLAPALAGLALISGCGFVDPKYEVGDQKLLLVPFRDMTVKFGHGYGETKRGRGIVEALRNWAETNADPVFADSIDTGKVVRELQNSKTTMRPADWRQLLGGIDADLVLVGEISEFRLQDPKTIGYYKGLIKGKYKLIRTRTGIDEYESIEYSLEFPRYTELDLPLPEFGTKPDSIEKGLLRTFGEQIAKDLFGYYPEEH